MAAVVLDTDVVSLIIKNRLSGRVGRSSLRLPH